MEEVSAMDALSRMMCGLYERPADKEVVCPNTAP